VGLSWTFYSGVASLRVMPSSIQTQQERARQADQSTKPYPQRRGKPGKMRKMHCLDAGPRQHPLPVRPIADSRQHSSLSGWQGQDAGLTAGTSVMALPMALPSVETDLRILL
jgi:hypothetical protein